MSIKIRNCKEKDVNESLLALATSPLALHYINANITRNSKADVTNYFEKFTEMGENVLRNSLRGFPLVGKEVSVPNNYKGVIFTEKKRPLLDDQDRIFQFKTAFENFTYWNYDKIPSRNDAYLQAMDWLEVSEVLHCEDTEENGQASNVKKADHQ